MCGFLFTETEFIFIKMEHESQFEPYDDNKLEHVLAAPDYGQVNGNSKWDIKQYPIYYFNVGIHSLKYKIYNILYII